MYLKCVLAYWVHYMKMKILPMVLLLVLSVHFGEAYRILGLFTLPSRSHMIVFERLMKSLVEKGHEVDVLSHFPQKNAMPGYNDISLRGTVPIYNYTVPVIRDSLSKRFSLGKYMLYPMGVNLCKIIFNSTIAKDLRDTVKQYDLAIVEIFSNDCMLGFSYHLKIPTVGIITTFSIPWGGDRIGNPDNPSYISNYFLPYLNKMIFMERLINAATLLMTKLGYARARDDTGATMRDFFGPHVPDLKELARNTSLILVNAHFGIDYVHPTIPSFVEVAGLHMTPPKTLPKYFQNSLDNIVGYKGVIYLSMGSMVLTETLPIDKLQALFDAFRNLPYKVLWKAIKEKIPKELDIPLNIQFEPWMPQFDILCHPNVKLFVSHGGLMGIQESVFCGVPVFGIPFFGDHEYSLKRAVDKGYGIMMDYDNITKSGICEAVKTILDNTNYKDNAERISKLFRDRPLSAIDTAIYWIEYVIRNKGAPLLRSSGADLFWYQYHLIDIGALLLLFLVTTTSLTYFWIAFIWRFFFLNHLPENNSKYLER